MHCPSRRRQRRRLSKRRYPAPCISPSHMRNKRGKENKRDADTDNCRQTFSSQAAVITLPTIARDLDIPPGRQQLVVSVYGLAFGCFLLLWGRIADIFNKRTIFVVGSIWVTLATAVTPFAPNEAAFHSFRALQGIVRTNTTIVILVTYFSCLILTRTRALLPTFPPRLASSAQPFLEERQDFTPSVSIVSRSSRHLPVLANRS